MTAPRARLAALVALGSTFALLTAGQGASAAPEPTPNPKASLLAGRTVTTLGQLGMRPQALDSSRRVRVLVELDGASVVDREAQAAATGQRPTKASKARDRAATLASQTPVVTAIRARGGRVDRRYAEVVSGLAVTIAASELDAIEQIPGVLSVEAVRTYTRDNGRSNNYTGASTAWTSYGTTGVGQKVAIIDSGVDYGHADFGGPGTVAYYETNDSTIIEGSHPFPTGKVVAGYDFVGDDYDASSDDPAKTVPNPDPDPLDCEGHGTHVAGTAAGQGVTSGGATYPGPYTKGAVDDANLVVPPGSAPGASVLAYRVFGCEGSVDSDVIVAAINRAVADGATVINMSLGSPYGVAKGVEQSAIAKAVGKGNVAVVVSAGNSGPVPYLVSAPSTAPAALSVAAADAIPDFPGAQLTRGGTTLNLLNANDAPLPGGAVTVEVLSDGSGGIGSGCDAADYSGTAGKLVVTKRGGCDRVARAKNGQAAGAAGVIMVNTSAGLPPFEGAIEGVTIPFLGATDADASTLLGLDGLTVTLASTRVTNPEYQLPASFTSSGPRIGDSGVKPEVIAPGVSIISAANGTGDESEVLSGTSMAAPHTAGIAALVRAANPTWKAQAVKNAIANTASRSPSAIVSDVGQRVYGNGMVQPLEAMRATVQLQATKAGDTGLSFGLHERTRLDETATVRLINTGRSKVTVNLTATASDGATLEVRPSRVRLGKGTHDIEVRIRMSESAVLQLPAPSDVDLPLVVGLVTATSAGKPTATMPVQVVQYARSNVEARLSGKPKRSTISVRNDSAAGGLVDLYEWLAEDGGDSKARFDLRALGLQSFTDGMLVFALAAHNEVDTAAEMEFDIWVDTTGDGAPDYLVVGLDYGYLASGYPDGTLGSAVINLETGDAVVYNALTFFNGSTVLLPLLVEDLGLSAEAPLMRVMQVDAYSIVNTDREDSMRVNAVVNTVSQQRTSGDFMRLDPGERATIPVTTRPLGKFETRSRGWMVVSMRNHSGDKQAILLPGGR